MSTVAGALMAVLASCLVNAAICLQAVEARAVSTEHSMRLSLLGRLIRRPRWLLGMLLAALAWPCQTIALLLAPLTVVQPADSAGLILLLIVGSRFLGEHVGMIERLSVAGIMAGVVGLTFLAPEREVSDSQPAELAIWLGVVALIAIAPFALRRFHRGGGLIVVLGAGFAFAWTAFATKLISDAIDTETFLILLLWVPTAAFAAMMGVTSEMSALQQRQATQVAPIIFVIEMLVPIALGLLVGGESWDFDALRLAGLILALGIVAASVAALAHSGAVAGMIAAGHEDDVEPDPPPAKAGDPDGAPSEPDAAVAPSADGERAAGAGTAAGAQADGSRPRARAQP